VQLHKYRADSRLGSQAEAFLADATLRCRPLPLPFSDKQNIVGCQVSRLSVVFGFVRSETPHSFEFLEFQ